ncbi:MAG: tetraacyldisaccharide 4'-kinase [Planctomycetota bacterium]
MLDILSGKDRRPQAAILRLILRCLTPFYRMVIWWRNRRFDQAAIQGDFETIKHAAIPVISVGNLTTGGTGKTPHVVALSKRLRQHGFRVAIVSRGYGADPAVSRNDEAMELEHRLPDVPHLQDPDRYAMTHIAVEELESQVVLLDDGFQHRQLHRDLDVVVIDATLPFGYGRLLPSGLLREPIDGLKRSDWVVLSRTNMVTSETLTSIKRKIEPFVAAERIVESTMAATTVLNATGQSRSINELSGKPSLAICGIGNPENFFDSLQHWDIELKESRAFPDHHRYDRSDLQTIGQLAQQVGVDQIVCTHKDLVKLGVDQIAGIPLWAIVIDVEFGSGGDDLFADVVSIAGKKKTP